MNEKAISLVACQLRRSDYRGALEFILEEMRSVSEDRKDEKMFQEIEQIMSAVFDIPNIDWRDSRK